MTSRKEALAVLRHWKLENEPISDVHPKSSGEGDVRAVYVGDDYVLKWSENPDEVCNAVALCEALQSADVYASSLIRTTDGRAYVQDGALFFYVTRRIVGTQLTARDFYGRDRTAKAQLLGEAIGKLHRALRQMKAPVNDVNLYESVKNWALPKMEDILPLPESFRRDYLHEFGALYSDLPKQIIHRDLNPSNIIVSQDKWGFIDFELSETNLRIYDPCYAAVAILSESFDGNDHTGLSTWLETYRNIMRGYDNAIQLTDKERVAIPYVVVAEQMASTAWFSEQNRYAGLFETNKRIAQWLISVFDELRFDQIPDSAAVHTATNKS